MPKSIDAWPTAYHPAARILVSLLFVAPIQSCGKDTYFARSSDKQSGQLEDGSGPASDSAEQSLVSNANNDLKVHSASFSNGNLTIVFDKNYVTPATEACAQIYKLDPVDYQILMSPPSRPLFCTVGRNQRLVTSTSDFNSSFGRPGQLYKLCHPWDWNRCSDAFKLGSAPAAPAITAPPTAPKTPTVNAIPPSTTAAPTKCDVGGFLFDGACFYLGGYNQTCRTACASRGGYSEKTKSSIGIYGNLAIESNCSMIAQRVSGQGLRLLGSTTYTYLKVKPPAGAGCSASLALFKTVSMSPGETNQDATTWAGNQRICGCNK